MKQIIQFIIDSFKEVKYKVTWPSYKSLQESAILILLASVVFAIVVGFVDVAFKNVVSWLYSIFS